MISKKDLCPKIVKVLSLAFCLVLLTRCATDDVGGSKDEEFASFDESAPTQAPTDTTAEETMEKEMRDGGAATQNKPPDNAAAPSPAPEAASPSPQPEATNSPPPDTSVAQNSPSVDEFSQFDSAPAQSAEPLPPPIVENAVPPPPPPVVEESRPVPAPEVQEAPKAMKHVQIRNLQFKANDGGGALSIEASGPFTYSTRMNSDTHQFVVEIPNASVAKVVTRGLNTKDFSGSIGSVDAYESSGGSARIVIQMRNGAEEPVVNQEGSNLIVSAGGAPKPVNPSVVADNIPGASTSVGGGAGGSAAGTEGSLVMDESSPSKILSTTSLREFLAGNQKFYGRKISFEATDADVKEIFKFLSEESGINLVLDENVSGRVTVRFRDVPWDQVLFVLMQQKGLGYIRSGQILRITKMEELKKQEDDYQHLEEDKEKILPLVVKMIPISYAQVTSIATQVKPFGSKRAQIVPDPRTSTVLVSDIPDGVDRIEKIIKSLDTPPLQVLIEAKIVEALDTFTHFVGVNWNTSGGSPVTIGTNSLGAQNNLSLLANNGASSQHAPILDLKITALDVLGDLDAALALGESTNEVRVLSSPRVMAMQNEPATITQQVNTPYTTNNQQTGGTGGTPTQIAPLVAFLTTQLSLNVTPQITNDASVILTVDLQRSFPDAKLPDAPAPATESRQAKTKIMVKNGQTAVIGGIYQSDSSLGKSGLPYLDDIPVLGWLFKSEETQKSKNELLVFITPRILGQADMGISTLSTIGSSVPKDLPPEDVKMGSVETGKTGL